MSIYKGNIVKLFDYSDFHYNKDKNYYELNWDLKDLVGNSVGKGIYVARIEVNGKEVYVAAGRYGPYLKYDDKNITLRNSIVGPDINPKGIGLLNWLRLLLKCPDSAPENRLCMASEVWSFCGSLLMLFAP